MASRRQALSRFSGQYLDLWTMATVYIALGSLPVFDTVTDDIAYGVFAGVGGPGIYIDRPWFWIVVGMLLVGTVYARLIGTTRLYARPSAGDSRLLAVAVLAPVVVGIVVLSVVAGLFDTSVAFVSDVSDLTNTPLDFVVYNAVVPALLIGVGLAVLFYGAIQEHLRMQFDGEATIAAVTVVAAFYQWLINPLQITVSRPFLQLGLLAVVIVAGWTPYLFVRMQSDDTVRGALTIPRVVVLFAAGYLLFGVLVNLLSGATSLSEFTIHLAWATMFGVGAWSYDRTNSIWWPALTLVVFQFVLVLLPIVEPMLGLATST